MSAATQVVDGEAELAGEPSKAAAEREPGDSGRRVDAERDGKAVLLRGCVELGERDARLHARGARGGIHDDALHRRQVDHEAVVAHGIAGDVVARAFDRDQQVVRGREANRLLHLRRRGAARDQARPAIDHRIPDGPRLVIAGRRRCQQAIAERGLQLGKLLVLKRDASAVRCGN